MKKKLLAGLLCLSMLFPAGGIFHSNTVQDVQAAEDAVEEVILEKSMKGNPLLGFDDSDNPVVYGGDPSILVDGDTVYAYVGHDVSTNNDYKIPEYLCYSTQDMVNWTYEGMIMNMTSVTWGANDSAWAAQVAKYKDKYYLYFCSWDNTDGNRQSIGVAVSDSATGPFVDIGHALVKGSVTTDQTSTWNDIDPTVWVEEDENGDDRIYLGWGNSKLYICELNPNMISVKDQNGDGNITLGADIISYNIGGLDFTEAPYFYRQQDEEGNYYGDYYIFYAQGWREKMAYVTTHDLMSGELTYGGELMPPTATSNTNHPAVFDFQGKTYFIYHNGTLPGGSGYRRAMCVEEFEINEDGSIDPIPETAAGISGKTTKILNHFDVPIDHENFRNSSDDSKYPIVASVGMSGYALEEDSTWVVVPGKADKENDAYVSIQSNNKPGLYLTARSGNVILTQDADGSASTARQMTFRTLKGFDGYGVTFESVSNPGYYLTQDGTDLVLSNNPGSKTASFKVKEEEERVKALHALKDLRYYTVGDRLKVDDLTVTAYYNYGTYYDHGVKREVTDYNTNADRIDMTQAGIKTLTVSYTEDDITVASDISITVLAKEQETLTPTPEPAPDPTPTPTPVDTVPQKGKTYTKGSLKYKVTKSARKNGTVAVVSAKKKTLTSITIPPTVKLDGYTFKVTSIQSKAFQNNNKLKTIKVGKNISSIGKRAFKGINKKATFKIPKAKYSAIKKKLTAKTGFTNTMKLKKV